MAGLADIGNGNGILVISDGASFNVAYPNTTNYRTTFLQQLISTNFFSDDAEFAGTEFWVNTAHAAYNDATTPFETYAVMTAGGEELSRLFSGASDYQTETIGGAAGGVITATRTNSITLIQVLNEAAAATDDLDTLTITNIKDGDIIILRQSLAGQVPTVKHLTGNIRMFADADVPLNDLGEAVWLFWDATAAEYISLSREDVVFPDETTTLLAAGGTISLDPNTNDRVQIFDGSPVLVAPQNITGVAGAPKGSLFICHYRGAAVLGANTLTIFGFALTAEQALNGATRPQTIVGFYDSTAAVWRGWFNNSALSVVKEMLDSNVVGDGMAIGVSGDIVPDVDGTTIEVDAVTKKLQMVPGGSNFIPFSITIATADVLLLNATPQVLIAAAGAGTIVEIVGAPAVFLDWNAAAYTTNVDLAIQYVGATDTYFTESQNLLNTADGRRPFALTVGVAGVAVNQQVINANIVLTTLVGNPAAGDSDITIYGMYRIITL